MSWVCLEQLEVLSRAALHILAVRHNIARTKQAHGTSRHRPEVSRANLGVDLFQSGGVLSARRKVLFEFFVPNELILPRIHAAAWPALRASLFTAASISVKLTLLR